MKKLIGFFAAVSVLVCVLCQSVLASTVVYSQPYNIGTAIYSDVNFPQLAADNFVLPVNYGITDVHWWGVYDITFGPVPASDNFTIAFHSQTGGGWPSVFPTVANCAAGDVGRTPTGDTVGNLPIYAYSYDLLAPLPLAGNTTYYISIYNDTTDSNWAWVSGDAPDLVFWYRDLTVQDWIVEGSGYGLAFQLTVPDGDVIIPEPVTSALFVGSVLLGLARLRRRRA